MSGDQKHQYHLVEPSPWPALGSAAGFTFGRMFDLWLHIPSAAVAKGEKPLATAVDLRPSVDLR